MLVRTTLIMLALVALAAPHASAMRNFQTDAAEGSVIHVDSAYLDRIGGGTCNGVVDRDCTCKYNGTDCSYGERCTVWTTVLCVVG